MDVAPWCYKWDENHQEEDQHEYPHQIVQKLIVIPQRGDTREFMINKHLVNLNPH